MAFEQFRTQVLLLHSQQSTLDRLSAGFSDRYSVHCATSGSEALLTLGETPIHVIVTAQELPGMSGLEALREARKRSPDTMGILLAGTDTSDGLEALVGDEQVFRIIRGDVTPEAIIEMIRTQLPVILMIHGNCRQIILLQFHYDLFHPIPNIHHNFPWRQFLAGHN